MSSESGGGWCCWASRGDCGDGEMVQAVLNSDSKTRRTMIPKNDAEYVNSAATTTWWKQQGRDEEQWVCAACCWLLIWQAVASGTVLWKWEQILFARATRTWMKWWCRSDNKTTKDCRGAVVVVIVVLVARKWRVKCWWCKKIIATKATHEAPEEGGYEYELLLLFQQLQHQAG